MLLPVGHKGNCDTEAHSSHSLSRYVKYAIFISPCITTNSSYIVHKDNMKHNSEEEGGMSCPRKVVKPTWANTRLQMRV